MPLDLYIRPRTSETDDRRTGAIAHGRVRLTAVDGAGKTLFEETVDADRDVILFVDELPSGSKRARGSSPERAVGKVPDLPHTELPAGQIEGRPGLGRPAARGRGDAEGQQDAAEGVPPASGARSAPRRASGRTAKGR